MTEACDLTQKKCTPCQGGIPPLTKAEAEVFQEAVPEWQLSEDGTRIRRSFTFKNFLESFRLVEKITQLAEDEGHHPDIEFGWGYLHVTFFTHKIQGLHENDFIIAAKVDELASG